MKSRSQQRQCGAFISKSPRSTPRLALRSSLSAVIVVVLLTLSPVAALAAISSFATSSDPSYNEQIAGNASQVRMLGVKVVPTEVCFCASQISGLVPGTMPFRSHGPAISSSIYDEQIGLTFTQSFTSMEYNVTAVEQTDPTLGDGPAYLLNGVSNAGYWYQVGVSWDWAPGESPGTGFDMVYEVFDASGNSIFPANGQGGVLPFSGPVNVGDVILLDLYFSTPSQNVLMLAEDTNTGALAQETYSNMGATHFVGLPDSVADQNGFFTGLMTEWYHGAPYYANEAEVIYSNPAFALSSA